MWRVLVRGAYRRLRAGAAGEQGTADGPVPGRHGRGTSMLASQHKLIPLLAVRLSHASSDNGAAHDTARARIFTASKLFNRTKEAFPGTDCAGLTMQQSCAKNISNGHQDEEPL